MKSGIRGFVVGSLALIIFYVAIQEGASGKAETASNALIRGMRRLLSPEVAGIGDHTKTDPTGGTREGGRSTRKIDTDEADALQGKLFTT